MKETTNNVFVVGTLVKKDFEVKEIDIKENGNVVGKDYAISGSLILRTNEGSEHEINYFSRQHKKDGGENNIFKALQTVSEEYKSLEHHPEDADVVRIGAGQFRINDYKGQDGEVKSYVQINANFANRLSAEEVEQTPQESKFEVEGVVETIKPEVIKDNETGNLIVVVNVIGYESTITPVKLTVMKDMAEAFTGAGFFESGYAKFWGKSVNTKETETVVEKAGFGQDNVRVVTKTISRLEVTGGSPLGMPSDNEIKDDEYEQAKSKRKLKLEEIKKKERNGGGSASSTNPFNTDGTSGANAGKTNANPFENPFAPKK